MTEPKNKSFFELQCEALGISANPNETNPSLQVEREKRRIETMELSPLEFKSSERQARIISRNPLAFAASLVAIAATVFLSIWGVLKVSNDVDSDLRIKGGNAVEVYIEDNGQVRIWDQSSSLRTNEKLQIKVFGQHNDVVFYQIIGKASGEETWITLFQSSEVKIPSALAISFDESIELTDPNLGEVLIVGVCHLEGDLNSVDELEKVKKEINITLRHEKVGALANIKKEKCSFYPIRLR